MIDLKVVSESIILFILSKVPEKQTVERRSTDWKIFDKSAHIKKVVLEA